MKKLAVAIACVFTVLSGTSLAADKSKVAAKTPTFVPVELELKGAKLGDSQEKISSDFALDCRRGSCSTSFVPGISTKNSIPDDKQTFATRLVHGYSFKFEDGKLIEMHLHISSDDFQLALLSLIDKFGEPQVKDKEVVQNSYGATYNNLKGTWKAKDGSTIYIERFFPDLKTTYIFMRDKDYLKRSSSSTKNPTKDI